MDSRKTVALALAAMMVAVVFSATVPLESEGTSGDLTDFNWTTAQENGVVSFSDGKLTITLDKDYKGTMNISQYTNQNISSINIIGNKHVFYGAIQLDALYNEGDSKQYSVTITDLTLDGSKSSQTQEYGVHCSNQYPNDPEKPARNVDFTMINCDVKNYAGKGIYLNNVTSVVIDHVDVENCAFNADRYPADNFQYYRWGDYAIDIDVTGTHCKTISLTNITFKGDCGDLGAVKIAQRGGAEDNDDMGTATIGKVVLSNLNFNGVSSETRNDIVLGSEPNVTGENKDQLRDYNSAFPVELDTSTGTSLAVWGSDRNGNDNLDLDIAANSSLSTVPTTTDGEHGSISITLERGSATASGKLGTNMSLTAGSGTSIAFVDFQNTGGNTIRIESGADYSGDAGDNVYVEPTPTPGYDDEELPPFVPTQPAEEDNTVTIVACAAAAAVAAILAVFLVIDRKP